MKSTGRIIQSERSRSICSFRSYRLEERSDRTVVALGYVRIWLRQENRIIFFEKDAIYFSKIFLLIYIFIILRSFCASLSVFQPRDFFARLHG